MKSKKVVLFIVEGPSDQSALSVILSKIFDQDEVYVYVVYGDVTAENGATPQNIVRKVNAFIKDHMSTYRLRKADMLQVVHLMDTDGAYVPDDVVTELVTVSKTVYNPRQIIAANRQQMRTAGYKDHDSTFCRPRSKPHRPVMHGAPTTRAPCQSLGTRRTSA